MCPRCNQETKTLGVAHLITPFWKNFRLIFAYPCASYPLIMIVLFCVPITVAETVLATNLFAPGMVRLVFFVLILLYGNEVFQTTITGNFKPPPSSVALDESLWLVFKQLLLLACIMMIPSLLARSPLSDGGAAVLFEIIKIPIPAVLILLLVNNSLASSLNPVKITVLISRIGWRYLLVYGFFSLLLLAPTTIGMLLELVHFDQLLVGRFLFVASQGYFFIILYFFLAYTVLQYHEKLGLEIEFTAYSRLNNPALLDQKEQTDPLLNDVKLLVRAGRPAKALELIRQESSGEITNPDLGLLYLKLLNQCNEKERLEYSGPLLIELFVSSGHIVEAANLYQKCLSRFTHFSITPEPAHRLYHWYLTRKEYEAAVQCGENFVERARADPRAPEVHLRITGLAITKLGDRKRAIKLIQGFKAAYPGHEKQQDAQKIDHWLHYSEKKPASREPAEPTS